MLTPVSASIVGVSGWATVVVVFSTLIGGIRYASSLVVVVSTVLVVVVSLNTVVVVVSLLGFSVVEVVLGTSVVVVVLGGITFIVVVVFSGQFGSFL